MTTPSLRAERHASTIFLPLLFLPLATGTASQSGVRPAAQPVELTRNGNHVDVRIGGRPFTTYYFDPSVAKPYFFPLRSAQGTVVTRGFPMTPAPSPKKFKRTASE